MATTTCPVFRPTIDELKGGFASYVRRVVDEADGSAGIIKIIPPTSFFSRDYSVEAMAREITVASPIKQLVTGNAGVFSVSLVNTEGMSLQEFHALAAANEFSSACYDERETMFWKSFGCSGIGSGAGSSAWIDPLYGADATGTLFGDDPACGWNVNQLDTLLQLLNPEFRPSMGSQRCLFGHSGSNGAPRADGQSGGNGGLAGITRAMLYVGMWRALFAFHVEDMNLYSINYLHTGAAKSWYSVPGKFHRRFEQLMQTNFPVQASRCPDFLRHKCFLLSPRRLRNVGMTFHTAVQEAGEFIITLPQAYHAGFNHGFNIAESSNFALPDWFPSGMAARVCKCEPFHCYIDVEELEARYLRRRGLWDESRRKLYMLFLCRRRLARLDQKIGALLRSPGGGKTEEPDSFQGELAVCTRLLHASWTRPLQAATKEPVATPSVGVVLRLPKSLCLSATEEVQWADVTDALGRTGACVWDGQWGVEPESASLSSSSSAPASPSSSSASEASGEWSDTDMQLSLRCVCGTRGDLPTDAVVEVCPPGHTAAGDAEGCSAQRVYSQCLACGLCCHRDCIAEHHRKRRRQRQRQRQHGCSASDLAVADEWADPFCHVCAGIEEEAWENECSEVLEAEGSSAGAACEAEGVAKVEEKSLHQRLCKLVRVGCDIVLRPQSSGGVAESVAAEAVGTDGEEEEDDDDDCVVGTLVDVWRDDGCLRGSKGNGNGKSKCVGLLPSDFDNGAQGLVQVQGRVHVKGESKSEDLWIDLLDTDAYDVLAPTTVATQQGAKGACKKKPAAAAAVVEAKAKGPLKEKHAGDKKRKVVPAPVPGTKAASSSPSSAAGMQPAAAGKRPRQGKA